MTAPTRKDMTAPVAPVAPGPRILINGTGTDEIAATDRGLAYGDGLFETLAIRNQQPEFWRAHMARLHRGCRRLNIPPPDAETVAAQVREVCQTLAQDEQAIVKIIITRGGGRGYKPPPEPTPTVIVGCYPWPDYSPSMAEDGVDVRLCTLRLGRQPALAGIKHLNRLENVLARAEWDDPNVAEGLLCDDHDHLIEGTMSNLFVVRKGALLTPDLSGCGVAGVMRDVVLDLARDTGLSPITGPIHVKALHQAEEIFLTNSIIGIWPVRSVEGRTLVPGPLTRTLQQALHARRHAAQQDQTQAG